MDCIPTHEMEPIPDTAEVTKNLKLDMYRTKEKANTHAAKGMYQ